MFVKLEQMYYKANLKKNVAFWALSGTQRAHIRTPFRIDLGLICADANSVKENLIFFGNSKFNLTATNFSNTSVAKQKKQLQKNSIERSLINERNKGLSS